MANVAKQISVPTSVSSNGRICFLEYVPAVESTKKCPLIIYLHGIDKNSSNPTTTTVLNLRNLTASTIGGQTYYIGGSGLGWLTNAGNPWTNGVLPSFKDPWGESHEFIVLVPQNNSGDSVTWRSTYIHELLDYAYETHNVDRTRIYLCGYSLGGGGTILAAGNDRISKEIAAAAAFAPGYSHGTSNTTEQTRIAQRGVPLYVAHCWGDEATNPCPNYNTSGACTSDCACDDPNTTGAPKAGECTKNPNFTKRHCGELISDQLVRKLNALNPLVPPLYIRYIDPPSKGFNPSLAHDYWHWMFDPRNPVTGRTDYPSYGAVGAYTTTTPNVYSWFLRHIKKSPTLPYYVTDYNSGTHACKAQIKDYTVTRNVGFSYSVAIQTLVSGTVPSYQYRLNDGDIKSTTSTGWSITVPGFGDHVLYIWPVCSNGERGAETEYRFTTSLGG